MPILQIGENGQLTGAKNVHVNGLIYDVIFEEGTAIDVFGSDLSLIAHSLPQATTFSIALLNSVFKDGINGNFDTRPELTAGCYYNLECFIATPYKVSDNRIYLSMATNRIVETGDYEVLQTTSLTTDYSINNFNIGYNKTYAKWQLVSSVQVPEPNSFILLILSLLGMMMHRKLITSGNNYDL